VPTPYRDITYLPALAIEAIEGLSMLPRGKLAHAIRPVIPSEDVDADKARLGKR
jgi:hypothetical protein